MKSHSFRWSDFNTEWYKRWAQELLQDDRHKENFDVHSNKFWQNAAIAQLLWKKGLLLSGKHGIGFGVGQERLPALFARYGVSVLATDQSPSNSNAKHWAAYELARNAKLLNRIGICNTKQFKQHVSYRSADMRKIDPGLYGKYDFVWSNCALGHLGTIQAGLNFVQESLRCLVPGGWAVHTTELNIISDKKTIDRGDTVLFRLRDIEVLQRQLIKKGYVVMPFVLTFGLTQNDRRISFMPKFGNNYSKIRIGEHIGTQIVFAIKKPIKRSTKLMVWKRLFVNKALYARNRVAMYFYCNLDPTLRHLRNAIMKPGELNNLVPKQKIKNIKIEKGSSKKVLLWYRNNSPYPIVGVSTPITPKPVRLATSSPNNRLSRFKDSSWASDNRPAVNMYSFELEECEIIFPNESFAFSLVINASSTPKGLYIEDFCLVQEQVTWIYDSAVRLKINVT